MTYTDFKSQYHIALNPQQEAAVQQSTGQTLVLAVPGSGKTTVVITRLGWLVLGLGINPREILSVTYTVSATRDMKERCAALFGPELADSLRFRTINGLCALVIRKYEQLSGRTAPKLLDSDSQISPILRQIYQRLQGEFLSESDMKELKTAITYAKNMQLDQEAISQMKVCGKSFAPVYNAYVQHLKAHSLMDYDDQLVFALQILKARRDILDIFRRRCRYINVDEAQDVSKIQHSIIALLAQTSESLFMVGDEDQSIYGFRAAYPQALVDFQKTWPQGKILLLEHNYRSTGEIIGRASDFIARNTKRHKKNMVTANPQGSPIRLVKLADRANQYAYLAKAAQSPQGTTAVLYRNNDSAIPLIDLLEKQGIPYRARQMETLFFTHFTVKDIISILRLAYEPENGRLFAGVYYKLGCGLKKTQENTEMFMTWPDTLPVLETLMGSDSLEAWVIGKLKNLQYDLNVIPKVTSSRALELILGDMGYDSYLDYCHSDKSRIPILRALARQTPDPWEFLIRLDELPALLNRSQAGSGSFVLSTIHSSKGLEYDHVFIIDVYDGYFPSIPEPTRYKTLTKEDNELLEEERRLFYVAITRAKQSVTILGWEREFGKDSGPMSSFITAVAEVKEEEKRSTLAADDALSSAGDFGPGDRVCHRKLGNGTITGREGDTITISLDDGRVKNFCLSACVIGGLIEKAL